MRGRAFFLVTLMVLMVQTAYVLGGPSAESTINSEPENAFSGNSTAPLHVLVNNTEMDPISFTAPWTSNNSNNSGSGGGSGMTSGVPVGILQGREYQNMEHVIDSNDKHHLIHYRYYDGLFYSTNSGGSWVTTMLDNGSNYLGSESDIVVDSNNDPHVVYKASGALNYTYLSNGVWSAPTTLDTLVYAEPKMAIDSNDTIHIVSIFGNNNGLANYTTNAGGSWTTETINQYSVNPLIADIALDSTGKVYIALITGTGTSLAQKQLNVYEKTGSTWSKDPVDSGQFGSTYKVELAIDANDVKHIYYQGSSGVFIKNDANGTWSSGNEYIAPTSGDGSVVLGDMKIEPNGTVHVVYRGSQCAVSWTSHCTFWYSTNSSGTWATRNIANITGLVLPTYNALELDSYGNLHYFFRNGTWAVNGTLFHLVENGVSTVGGSSGGGGSGGSGTGSAPVIYNGNGTSWLVADINPNGWDYIQYLTTVGTRLFFGADDGTHGEELWTHETTNGSTWMVADIRTNGSGTPEHFLAIGTRIFFEAVDDNNNHELYAHEMSNDSTWRVTNFSIFNSAPTPFGSVGSRLFFYANDGTHGREVWVHEMTNDSTWMVGDINNGSSGSGPGDGIAVGTRFYFRAQDWGNGNNGGDIWVYETTNESFWKFTDHHLGGPSLPRNFVSIGTKIFFGGANNSSGDHELWVIETTNESTWQATDVLPTPFWSWNRVEKVTAIGSKVVFSSRNPNVATTDLWIHETTNESTWKADDLALGWADWSIPFAHVGTRLFFQIDDASNGSELGAFEITNESSWMVDDLPGHPSAGSGPNHIVAAGTQLFFQANNASASGLWAHDPANIGSSGNGSSGSGSSGSGLTTYNGNGTTWQAFDLFGLSSSSPKDLTPIGDVLYFSTGGLSLWAYNTSNQTEWEVHDFNPNGSDDIREIFALGTRLYFEAKDDNNPVGQPLNTHLNKQLWTYETTNETAWKLTNHTFVSQVGTHNNVAKHLFYGGFSLMGTRLYFTAEDSNGVQIWAHETTNESTWAVTNIGMYGVQAGQDPILVMGSQLYFSADNGDNEGSSWGAPRVYNELWAYDTTNETAWRTSNHCTPGCHGFSSSDHSMTSIGTRIFFTGSNNVTPTELFAHETTNGSTWLVEDISPSNNNPTGRPLYYVSMGSTIYFEAEDNQSGREPWAYDVTNDTAWQVCDVNPNSSVNGGDGGFFQQFAMGDRIFFQGDDGIHGSELWALDTINGACWMVADINTYSAGISSSPSGFAAVGNQLYFAASKKISQNKWDAELWVHDPANLTFNGSGGSSGTSGGGGGISNASVIWSISPSLPTGVNIDQVDGTISGTPTQVMGETIYTVLATHSSGNSTTFEVSLMVLEDTDGDGDPDSLPVDYDTTGPTPGLVEDLDDDNDGYADVVETNTGTYSGTNDTGTDPLNPDTDGDGICDGPNDVPPICTAGPDRDPPTNVVGVIDIAIETVEPYLTFPNMTYTISPELPAGLVFDSSTGELSGTATSPLANTTFTVYGNLSNGAPNYSWQFTIEILDDSDGDGLPNELPIDYPLDGELIEDTDDDNDGLNDTTESGLNTSTTNPDTDGDGFCDGPIAIINGTNGVTCYAGPDPYPLDSNAPLDTDGDGLPDENDGWTGPPMEDEDDDNDGYPDVSELACGSDPLNASSHPNDMDGDAICDGDDDDMDGDGIDNANETGNATTEGTLPDNPDTDGDGVCDGPISPITSNCIAGPDDFPLDPSAWLDTDDDGYPDEVAGNSTSVPPLVEDDDDDNDGWNDTLESDCLTDSKDELDVPADLNDDGLCDVNDDDWDDDGVTNDDETNTSLMGTDPWDPDTDDDGFCDGPIAFEGLCYAGPDPYPLDPNAPIDTDGDGLPDENDGWTGPPQADDDDDNDGTLDVDDAFPLDDGADTDTDGDGDPDTILYSNYDGPLIADEDDDDDGWNDTSEIECSTDPLDSEDVPVDDDDNGVCDILDPKAEISGDGENEEDIIENSENLNIFSIWSCCILLLMLLLIFALLYRRSDDERDEQFVVFEIDDAFDDEDDELKKQSVKNKEEEYNEIYGSDEDATISEKKAKLAELDAQLAAKEAEINALNAAAANKVDFDTIGTATASEKDDLTKIKGIGPVLQGKLNDAGIFTLKQLSKVTPEIENQIDEAIGYFPGRLSREKVFDQARELLKN